VKKRILILSHGLDGGINRVSTDLLDYVNSKTDNLCMIVRVDVSIKGPSVERGVNEINISFRGDWGWGVGKIFAWVRARSAAVKSIPDDGFDVVIYSGLIPAIAFLGCFSARRTKRIFWEHGPQKTFTRAKLLASILLPNYEKIISPSRSSLKWLDENLGINARRRVVIDNWVNWRNIRIGPGRGRKTDGLRIIVASRIDFKQKDFGTLVSAIQIVRTKISGVILVDVYGGGPDESRLRELVRMNSLDDVIHVKGHVCGIYNIYGCYDLSILPTNWEGFGLSIAESMAAEVPVISAAVEGVVDIVDDGVNGFLYTPNDPTSLAACILKYDRLPSNERRRMAENGRGTVLARFDPDRQLALFCEEVVSA